MESAANRLQKEAKGYLDSLRGDISFDVSHGSNDCLADSHRGNHSRQSYGTGALQIVAESTELTAIFLEDATAIAGPEILPLQ